MSRFRLIIRSLYFYRRSWLGVLAGTALTAMIITGALLIGDSAKITLRKIALQRLGETELAMAPSSQFFKDDLARRMEDELRAETTSVLSLRGIGIAQQDGRRNQANNVQVLGVQPSFWNFAGKFSLAENEVAINRKLADKLDINPGDELSVRIEKPSLMPREAPLSSRMEDLTARQLFVVAAIVPDTQLGRFSLETSQRTPPNIFLDLSRLQKMAGLDAKANVMLVKREPGEKTAVGDANNALQDVYRPEDFGIRFRAEHELDILQIESESVYIPNSISDAVDGYGVLNYMVNMLSSASNQVPYSFATAIAPSSDPRFGPVPKEMRDDQILVNSWLAEHLSVGEGDKLQMRYYQMFSSHQFVEHTNTFQVYGVVDIEELKNERILTPHFPGLTDIDSCADWDIGLPMNQKLLQDEANEEYWDRHKDTPKAFITLARGRKLWGNRFGDTTAIRLPLGKADQVRKAIRSKVSPSELGYFFTPVREQALQAVNESVDLGQLFLGMSFFLVLSSLLIIAFLFGLTIQQRARQCGLLLSTGFRPKNIHALLLAEGGMVAVAGAFIGSLLAFAYTHLLLLGINGEWKGAVANSAIQFHYRISSPLYGILATVVFALLAMYLVLRKQLKLSVNQQIRGDLADKSSPHRRRSARYIRISSAVALIGALAIVANGLLSDQIAHAANSFFMAGSLLLISSLLFVRQQIDRPHPTKLPFKISSFIATNIKSRRNHSLGIVALLACGCFLVFAVSSMRENLTLNISDRSSGTGGFDYFAQSTIPLLYDLDSDKGRAEYRLQGVDFGNVINIKVHAGDDSSCFNLNRSMSPPLLGVDPDRLARLNAFEPGEQSESIWDLLDMDLPDNTIPAIVGDSDTLMWGLKKRAGVEDGDILEYRNEQGRQIKVKLVAALPMRLSVFQGNLLISNDDFTRHFPSESGSRMFLIDIDDGQGKQVRKQLVRKLERYGFEMTPSAERLQAFYAIEKAYLSIFLLLGGFGLILGAAGMGSIVWRNIAERRTEIEILSATGFSRNKIREILACEYITLLLVGILCGSLSALLAIAPNLFLPGANIPWPQLIMIAVAIALAGSLFVVGAIFLATGRPHRRLPVVR